MFFDSLQEERRYVGLAVFLFRRLNQKIKKPTCKSGGPNIIRRYYRFLNQTITLTYLSVSVEIQLELAPSTRR